MLHDRDVPSIPFQKADVFAFIDSDSPEAKQFTTYLGYWDCLARTVTETYGDYHMGVVAELRSRKKFRALTATKCSVDEDLLRKLLLGAWNSELGLYLVDQDDPRLTTQNQWNNVYAYYATGRAALAWLLVRTGAAPERHRALLRAMSTEVHQSVLFPRPWSLTCTSLAPSFAGFATPPEQVSNLAFRAGCFDMAAKALKTTREKRISELKKVEVAKAKLKRAPNGLAARLDGRTEPTSVFDFLWRSRTRANYGDASMFYMGTLDDARSKQYLYSVRTFTDATMLVLEGLIAQRAKHVLAEAAVHYISRDRSKLTDRVLGKRLRALGLL
jgi:hypothetical protein